MTYVCAAVLTVVGCTLAELNRAQQIGDGGNAAGDASECSKLLVGRLPIVVFVYQSNFVVEDRGGDDLVAM